MKLLWLPDPKLNHPPKSFHHSLLVPTNGIITFQVFYNYILYRTFNSQHQQLNQKNKKNWHSKKTNNISISDENRDLFTISELCLQKTSHVNELNVLWVEEHSQDYPNIQTLQISESIRK